MSRQHRAVRVGLILWWQGRQAAMVVASSTAGRLRWLSVSRQALSLPCGGLRGPWSRSRGGNLGAREPRYPVISMGGLAALGLGLGFAIGWPGEPDYLSRFGSSRMPA
jgi:hypothetical protein